MWPGICNIKSMSTVYPRLLLPCLGSGFVPCSYEQSKCNLEAGSRLLHPLVQELPLLPGLLSSQSDTARSDCITALKCCFFQKHKTYSFFPKHFPKYCTGIICYVFGLICIWIANLSPPTVNTSKQFHAQIAPEHTPFQLWWMLFPWTKQRRKEGFTDWNWQKHHALEMGEASRAHKGSWYLCNPVML